MIAKISKATIHDIEKYRQTHQYGELYGYITVDGKQCIVEILPPDDEMKYEAFVPDGFLFDGELTSVVSRTKQEICERLDGMECVIEDQED